MTVHLELWTNLKLRTYHREEDRPAVCAVESWRAQAALCCPGGPARSLQSCSGRLADPPTPQGMRRAQCLPQDWLPRLQVRRCRLKMGVKAWGFHICAE